MKPRLHPAISRHSKKLAVKANLVVPLLLPDGELYGLLILHQCSQPRAWQPEEITLTAQMALQIGWALDNAIRWSQCQKIQSSLDRQRYYDELMVSATQKIHQGTTRAEVLRHCDNSSPNYFKVRSGDRLWHHRAKCW